MNIVEATRSYERWLASQTEIVRPDLRLKHARMRESAFVFLRGTFYRWVQHWPGAGRKITDAPLVLSIGDLHVENFGTWRDTEGRLVWGVTDMDDVCRLPYTHDLVRLVTSAVLAIRHGYFSSSPREVSDAVLEGYATSIQQGGRPIVLAERRRWLRDIALNDLRDAAAFWAKLLALPKARGTAPHRVLRATLPAGHTNYRVSRRVAGIGSLGRARFVAIADWNGALVAREAKARVPSAAVWAGLSSDIEDRLPNVLLRQAIRAADPCVSIHDDWSVRRLAPDCYRIDLADLPKRRDERKLLRAMGWETGNLHLATATPALKRDVRRRDGRWLLRAATDLADATVADWREWRQATARSLHQ